MVLAMPRQDSPSPYRKVVCSMSVTAWEIVDAEITRSSFITGSLSDSETRRTNNQKDNDLYLLSSHGRLLSGLFGSARNPPMIVRGDCASRTLAFIKIRLCTKSKIPPTRSGWILQILSTSKLSVKSCARSALPVQASRFLDRI